MQRSFWTSSSLLYPGARPSVHTTEIKDGKIIEIANLTSSYSKANTGRFIPPRDSGKQFRLYPFGTREKVKHWYQIHTSKKTIRHNGYLNGKLQSY